jgi:hypothetical protein
MKGKRNRDAEDQEYDESGLKLVAQCPEFSLYVTSEPYYYIKRSKEVERARWKYLCRIEDSEKVTAIDERIAWFKALRHIYYFEIARTAPDQVPRDFLTRDVTDPAILAEHLTSLIGAALKRLVSLHHGGLATQPARAEMDDEIGRLKGLFGSAVGAFAAAEQLTPEGLGKPLRPEDFENLKTPPTPKDSARLNLLLENEKVDLPKRNCRRFEAQMILEAEEIFVKTKSQPTKAKVRAQLESYGFRKNGRNLKKEWKLAFDRAGLGDLPE